MKEILEKYDKFKEDIDELDAQIKAIRDERTAWSKENRKLIKSFYPKRNKIYQIKDINDCGLSHYRSEDLEDFIYYFKSSNPRFAPDLNFNKWNDSYPTVKGQILDSNLKNVTSPTWDIEICITNLKEIEDGNNPLNHSNRLTKVYVMLDKNTGYYKIGRSKNPTYRERTLQSEKPTIEMLFNWDAKVKDEKVLHDKFQDKRIRGEWFDLSGGDLNCIKEYFS